MTYLLDAASAAAPALPGGCVVAFSTVHTYLAPTGAPSGRRQYLCHGLNANATTWDSGPYLTLANSLRAAGDSLVLLNLPVAQACAFVNGGWQYREQFNAQLNAVMDAVEAAHGTAPKNVIGGISYGGLHAMMAIVLNGRFMAWWVHLPVVRVDALGPTGNPELANVGNIVKFNPQYEVAGLSLKKGLIGYGTADTRVKWQLTRDLAAQLPQPLITVRAYPGLDHTTNAAGAADIAAWTALV